MLSIVASIGKFINNEITSNDIQKQSQALWHGCFLVSFVKLLRTPFLQNTCWWLLLDINWWLDGIFFGLMKLTKSYFFWIVYSLLPKKLKFSLSTSQDNMIWYQYLKLLAVVVIDQLFLILLVFGFLQHHKTYQHLILLDKLYYIL